MSPFGWWIALYFALATVAAGVAGAACVLLMRGDAACLVRARMGLLIACVAVGMGLIALIADLEHPSEFWLTIRYYNPASWISRGSRIVMVFSALSALLLVIVRNAEDRGDWAQMLVPLFALFALSLAIYPALVLGQELGRPNWQSPVLPVLFLAGAVHVGGIFLRMPSSSEIGLVALEATLLGAFLLSTGAVASVMQPATAALLGLGIVFMWLLPIVMKQDTDAATVLSMGSLAIGGFGIRSVILMSGSS